MNKFEAWALKSLLIKIIENQNNNEELNENSIFANIEKILGQYIKKN